MTSAAWIMLIGALCGVSCALLGTFLVLRRMSLLGDAISHAILPGIALAFFISGRRSALPMLLGAGALGLVTVALVEGLRRTRRLAEDASIGIVFPALFALGVVMISSGPLSQVDLDLDCVLYGEIAVAPLDTIVLFGDVEAGPDAHGHGAVAQGRDIGPRAFWILSFVLLLDLAFVLIFYKELKICTFDPELAATLGFRPALMHYLLMGLVSVTTVAAFESVGAILVVALLIAPAAAAYLLANRLSLMLGLAVLFGVLSSVLGYELASMLDAAIAGSIACVAGLLFMASLFFSPVHGLIVRALRRRRLAERFARENVLLGLFRLAGREPQASWSVEAVKEKLAWKGGPLEPLLATLVREGLAARTHAADVQLTAGGKKEAARLLALRFGEAGSPS